MGWSIAHLLASEGASVLCTDIQADAVEACAADIRSAGGSAIALRHDVTSASDWEAAVAALMDQFGRLDVLVNNAGIHIYNLIEDVTLEEFRKVYSTNCEGPFLGMRSAVPLMRRGGGGSIVNIGAVCTRLTSSAAIAYTAAKAGLVGMSRAAAVECAPYGVRCNVVHPGTIWTNMMKESANHVEREAVPWAKHVPMKRIGDGADIAAAVLYFASDEARYVTGAELFVDGGLTQQLSFGRGTED
jgi:NAD(P)-dependent dehydrogenase (short-subunit alcohol dehydrogenase family)